MNQSLLKKIKIIPLKIVEMPEGNIMHALKKKELKNWTFSEAYFSKIKAGKIKAWKFHTKMTLNLIVPRGKVKFVFYSKLMNKFRVVQIGEKNYSRLTVPPKLWFGFKGVSKYESIILNLTNIRHDPKEIIRCKKNKIKFNW
jgi:dTDP-4-dehydrorhamnose 3,5-epimerase